MSLSARTSMRSAAEILATLDAACDSYAFPMLDNGYVYLAATRLSLFRYSSDWAMLGLPDLAVSTLASTRHNRNPPSNYVNEDAHRNYLRTHPHDDSRHLYPIEDGPWIDEEFVAEEPGLELSIRGRTLSLPSRSEYERVGIELEDSKRVHVFELCRYVAAIARDQVLAIPNEQRVSVLPEMDLLPLLDEWHHPDLANDQRPSELQSFRQLAEVLSTGDASRYTPTPSPNTRWKNWPEGGTL